MSFAFVKKGKQSVHHAKKEFKGGINGKKDVHRQGGGVFLRFPLGNADPFAHPKAAPKVGKRTPSRIVLVTKD